MTKQDLLDELDAIYDFVEEVQNNTGAGHIPSVDYTNYNVKVWTITDEYIGSHNIQFYVYDEGGENEKALYSKEEHEFQTIMHEFEEAEFLKEVEDLIATQIATDVIKFGEIVHIDGINEVADVRILKTSTSTEAFKYIYRDSGTGDLTWGDYTPYT